MAGTDGTTQNYGWTLPAVHGSPSSWGDKLNANFQGVDSQVKANEDAIAQINNRFASNYLTLTKATVAAGAYIASYLNSALRWAVWLGNGTPEGGNDTGSDLAISRYHDDGSYIDAPLTIVRQTGQVVLSQDPTTAGSAATKAYVDAGANVVGAVTMFAGVTPPGGWTWCSGAAISRTSYAALFAVIGTRFGAGDGSTTFNLPNLFGRMPVGYDGGGWAMGLLGGEQNHTLSAGEMPVHAHGITDVAHAHGITQSGHVHPDPGHAHSITDQTHAHSYTVTSPGGGPWGAGTQGAGVGSTTGASATGITGTNVAGTNLQAANANITINAAGTGLTGTSNAGGGGAHNNMPPYQVIGFIIRLV